MRKKDREKELLKCLVELTIQSDEDLPGDLRTKHFRTALEDAKDLIKRSKIL